MAEIDLSKLLDEVLEDYDTDIDKVSSEGTGNFSELPDGYYLCEVDKAELAQSKNTGKLMSSFKLKILEDGISLDENDNIVEIKGTKGRLIFKHYILQDEDISKQKENIDKLISDLKKFEGEPGVPLVQPLLDELSQGNLTKSEFIQTSLEYLSGMRIWVNVNTTERNGKKNTWVSLISWARARKLGIEPDE